MGKEKIDQQDVKLNTVDSSSKIDAIKQLIFGENMQAYESEFETLKQDILNKKEALENLIDEVKTELLQNIDNLSTDINIRITELEASLQEKTEDLDDKKLDRRLLGELFTKLGEKISQ
ncbi:fructose 1,6-bisphosphatase [Mesoflavibacter profundi]|uniref:Fructose 1,6-bisphosphatase n=1 Tax=Mesoflavibacter profundi TaxID=2708110 RepID=A0ABT4S2E4_9FLAO|nr:fructose 1,6-bisphosphatase [Mesoflavibacter profundi]MDA0178175.1 fructose 1,6-bisphosphatase [Mesoflavibacter profundi]